MEIIKDHPYISIGALLATVAVVFYVSAGGGSETAFVAQSDPNAVAAGTALQQSQMQQQVALTGISASLQAKQSDNATGLALADLQGKYSYDVAELAAGIRLSEISAGTQTQQLVATLDAQSKQADIQAQTERLAIQSNTMIQTTQTVANALVAQSAQQAAVAMASINNQCHGFGCLF